MDLFTVLDNGPYRRANDAASAAIAASIIYQPLAMRWRGVNVLTNTVPREQQRSPGPMQANGMCDPVITKAAKQLGLDQVEIRKMNSPEGKALFGPAGPDGKRQYLTSAFIKEALDRGAEKFRWAERKARSGQRMYSSTQLRSNRTKPLSLFVTAILGNLLRTTPNGIYTTIKRIGSASVFQANRSSHR